MEEGKKFVEEMFSRGILFNKEVLSREVSPAIIKKIELESDLIVLNPDYVDVISMETNLIDWYEIDEYRVELEKERDEELYQVQLQTFKESSLLLQTSETSEQRISSMETEILDNQNESCFSHEGVDHLQNNGLFLASSSEGLEQRLAFPNKAEIVISYKNIPRKYEVKDFTNIFVSRYRFLEGILRNHQELQNTMAISRILSKKEKESVSLIGLVDEVGETRTGNLILTIEDLTGKIKVLVSPQRKELFQKAKELVFDEVVGVFGVCGNKIVFADEIVWPDIPSTNELKKGPVEEYAIFLSDIHVGSNLFLKEEFEKFLHWINGNAGSSEQKEIAKKVRYVFIAGDLVDGVGVYPSQLDELEVQNIISQYEEFSKLIRKIPADKQIIICPGNHDAVHLAEPQSSFNERFSPSLFNIPNAVLVTNPSLVNIGKTKSFPGFDVLLYHGYSFDYYVANVESIRNNGGYHRADLIMKFLLKRRHLAPSFRSTPYFPGQKEDPLLIKKIPDFLVSGHIHYSKVANYKGVTTICGSCWQGKTSFQEKLGHEPEPARVPIINLKTREVKILKFA